MPDVERILQSTPGTLSQQWYEDGTAVDPGTVTVGITRADGTELVAEGTSTSGTGTGPRTYNLTTTHTALLDRLTVTWTSTTKGTLRSYVEVVGGFVFSIAEARAMKPLDNTTLYTSSAIADARTKAETFLEGQCGFAFVPRYHRESVTSWGGPLLRLSWPYVRTVRDATVDSIAVGASDLETMIGADGAVYYPTYWPRGYGNTTVGYEHGHDFYVEATRPALLLARHYLVASPGDDRATSISTEFGAYSLVTPGVRGAVTSLPEVNAFIESHRMAAVA